LLFETVPLKLESLQPSFATKVTLPSHFGLDLWSTSATQGFKHLPVAAATATWHGASPLKDPAIRPHEPFMSLRGPSFRSLVSPERKLASETPFQPIPFAYFDLRPETIYPVRPEVVATIIASDFDGDHGRNTSEALHAGSGETEPGDTSEFLEAAECLDDSIGAFPELFVAAAQQRVYPMSFSLQRSHLHWSGWITSGTHEWTSSPIERPAPDIADDNFWRGELVQSGVRAFGPFRMQMNAQPQLEWSPCRTSAVRPSKSA